MQEMYLFYTDGLQSVWRTIKLMAVSVPCLKVTVDVDGCDVPAEQKDQILSPIYCSCQVRHSCTAFFLEFQKKFISFCGYRTWFYAELKSRKDNDPINKEYPIIEIINIALISLVLRKSYKISTNRYLHLHRQVYMVIQLTKNKFVYLSLVSCVKAGSTTQPPK